MFYTSVLLHNKPRLSIFGMARAHSKRTGSTGHTNLWTTQLIPHQTSGFSSRGLEEPRILRIQKQDAGTLLRCGLIYILSTHRRKYAECQLAHVLESMKFGEKLHVGGPLRITAFSKLS
ncbi:hypothetical protein Z043_106241 [Scleropages formosus]|uniref:Uncharacterized protein n=1 Tax=Scleropages formosus TaxID=113540 RepID=A0A0P7UWY1_SCLFO|nr:hypothetical protein Z043_106241 [Scleropages formosus]